MNSKPSISVVVPVYNSEKSLPLLVERLESVLASTADAYEILFVNDGSADNSWHVIETLMCEHEHIFAINLMRNFGQHNALLCGIRAANYEFIVTIDDDLQNPPESIPLLVEKLNEGCDVVYGSSASDVHGNFLRSISSWIIRKVLEESLGADVTKNLSSFRAFRTQLRQGFGDYNSSYISIDVLLTWSTTSFAFIKVEHAPREFGSSTYSMKKLFRHSINLITGFSTWPLQIASFLGFVFMFFGLGILVYVVGRYLYEGSVPGFSFLASTIAIFSGVQLFAMGIFGEYLLRIYERTMSRPPYLERVRRYSLPLQEESINETTISRDIQGVD